MVKVYFENIRQEILREINEASESIIVAVYWFTNEDLFQKLLSKIDKGIRVELIIHNDYINNRDTGLNFQKFINKGGHFYFSSTYNPMHNKFCIIDDKTLINGSYNWTYYAEDRNRENILILKDEAETTKSFILEFNRLKSLTEKVENIRPLTRFEVDEFNFLRARDYLANDIIFQAKETGKKEIVENAFLIAPDNIEVQKIAFELDLTKRWKLKHSIGTSLKFDRYLVIIPRGTMLPVSLSQIVQTSEDNQRSSSSTIHYGENPRASRNKQFAMMKIYGIPPKPAGEAKLKYHFTIDIYGNLKMEKFSLDNGRRQIINHKITNLLIEEERD